MEIRIKSEPDAESSRKTRLDNKIKDNRFEILDSLNRYWLLNLNNNKQITGITIK